MKKRTPYAILAALCLSLLLTSLAGCGGASSTPPGPSASSAAMSAQITGGANRAVKDEAGYGEIAVEADIARDSAAAAPQAEPAMPAEDYENAPTGGGDGISAAGGTVIRPNAGNRKIIYTANVSLQTKEFEQGIAVLEQMTQEAGGFIQSSSVQGRSLYDHSGRENARYAYYTVRVPQDKLSDFLAGLEGSFNVGSTSVSSEDITLSYFDVKARLESLYIQQERLLEMLEKAEDVEYLIEVQKELARVGYEIESYTSSINRMDDALDYSTVHLSVEEVLEYDKVEPLTASFGEQAGNAFTGAWKSFAEFCRGLALAVVSITPFLAFALPAGAVVIVLALRRRKKRRALMGGLPSSAPRDPGRPPQPPAGEENRHE